MPAETMAKVDCFLNEDVLLLFFKFMGRQHRISSEDVFRCGPSKELADAVFEIATKANDHLITARSFMDKVPSQSFPAFLPAVSFFNIHHAIQKQ